MDDNYHQGYIDYKNNNQSEYLKHSVLGQLYEQKALSLEKGLPRFFNPFIKRNAH